MTKHIWLTKSWCTCSDCDFECEYHAEMVAHCRKFKHDGECTSQKAIHFNKK